MDLDECTSIRNDVRDYLHRILNATDELITVEERCEDDDVHMTTEKDARPSIKEYQSHKSLNEYILGIANNLLKSCNPAILISGVSHLPKIDAFRFNEKLEIDDDENLTEEPTFFYEHRRSDYLRQLLRVMAPISMEVAANVCSIVIAAIRHPSSETQRQQQELASVILFSHWLPVAPHLTPMATDMFTCISNPWGGSTREYEGANEMLLLAEALHQLSSFFFNRGEISFLRRLGWEWTFVFNMIHNTGDGTMHNSDGHISSSTNRIASFLPSALKWYAVRILSLLMGWNSSVTSSVLNIQNVEDDRVPWKIHPWELDQEELDIEKAYFQRNVSLWTFCEKFKLPSSEETQKELESSPYLAKVGPGINLYKQGSLLKSMDKMQTDNGHEGTNDNNMGRQVTKPVEVGHLVPTATTNRNLALLGAALCHDPHPPPILVCGPHGSGKSSMIRELLHLCRPKESLIEFHIDEETDSKTLIGSYTTTDIPGEFAWRAGALTNASREGRWVVIEDLDGVPLEIQAALVKLFEERMIPLGNGKYERCHPNFRIFATCTTNFSSSLSQGQERHSLRIGSHRGGGKQILNPCYWRNVHVKPMPFSELKEVAISLFPDVPLSVIDSAMALLQTLDRSGRECNMECMEKDSEENVTDEIQSNAARVRNLWVGGRIPSVRDLFKLLSRISNGICFEKDALYTTEAQRTLCMAESVDIFLGSCSDQRIKDEFVGSVAAPVWGITRALALNYIRAREPSILVAVEFFEIGRAKFNTTKSIGFFQQSSTTFAETNHALRLMESIAVCVRENEPILLVGETGCGKTTNIQQLAARCERTLVVQNLSLQTDSTDLLGGYRPLEIQNVARNVYKEFVDTFVSSFSRKQNLKFLQYASSMLEKSDWKKLSQSFKRAAQLGVKKMKDRQKNSDASMSDSMVETWQNFAKKAERFERQRVSCDAGLAFEFAEGALVDAIQTGKWVLLDEINLASSDTLQRLCGLLDEPTGSLTLTERGDATAIKRHPNFRLFAAMNPATDAGKKDLPASIRCRFSEIYVDELLDPIELRLVTARCLDGVLPNEGNAPEHTEIVACIVDQYLRCRELAETTLSDGNGHKPRYTLRTLSRALKAAKTLVVQQRIRLKVAIYEGFQLSFEGILDSGSIKIMRKMLKKAFLQDEARKIDLDHPGRRPGGRDSENAYVLIKPFWIKAGPLETTDWSEIGTNGKSKFILTKTALTNLRRLAQALATGPWPILLEGPTSSGKTTLVEYIAARCGHHVVRINNHEHTDVQEYTGAFAADQNGSLSFRDGILVQALRRGHWVILDELNLAPSEVLEALNRLLDDNRELYLAETNETVKPHPNFRLFATQNPSGAYGGRKPLSRAFRNRFVELHVGDIPSDEMSLILEKRCGCPPSHSKLLVKIMVDLRLKRSKSNLFLGKDSFITPRDLLRWAERQSGSKKDLAEHGYMVLAERLRSAEEKQMVLDVLEEHTKVKIDLERLYYHESSEAKKILDKALAEARRRDNHLIASIAPTRSMLRLIHLVSTCVRQKEPVLLVGDTGCGKTTVIQLLSFVLNQMLYSVNCHATTETSDLIGGLRPVRGRDSIKERIVMKLKELIQKWPYDEMLDDLDLDLYSSTNDKDKMLPISSLELYDVDSMVKLAQTISSRRPGTSKSESGEGRTKKRRKVTESSTPGNSNSDCSDNLSEDFVDSIAAISTEIDDLGKRYRSLFEWSDGPLVKAMKSGQLMLLDEMSLAEDAVLERLNSVLEPSRCIVLAEKGDDGSSGKDKDDRVIVAHDSFRIFATMNPGGDYGKRELSPALRSRFTEIWVPSLRDRSDFKIVMERSFTLSLGNEKNFDQSSIVGHILDYVEWFNSDMCGSASSPYSGFSLSLRDILSWAHFIVEAKKSNSKLTICDALYHGACLMHLDGLGLGSGLASESSTILKTKAEQYLLGLVTEGKISNAHSVDEPICIQNGKFGVSPYFINIGQCTIPKSTFNMTAPTTSLNAFRVLRAMQLRKPILLEGSPGVGKTSLVSALASASGNKLVRINLSEQTDISDLMGSDLPVENSTNDGPSFEWCDGVLLTAIKEGSWVLLDELNLASQAVLEGLNSCLDHRATMYIPELGMSFECPSTFRIFAAQNPLGQGGGRKGLPKSFLNRFTKVYVDALTDSDLRSIVSLRFKSFSEEFVNQIIDFNNDIHHEVVDSQEYGSDGGPWEFNLRDVFRWCELIEAGHSSYAAGARDLYYQRFRTQNDRNRVDTTFRKHFGCSMIPNGSPEFEVLDSSVRIGETKLSRLDQSYQVLQTQRTIRESDLLFSRLVPMEAVARCINLRWPCLLVGGSGTGKTSIVSSLAGLCNATLVEHCLSPSSDVSELVGGYEQSETMSKEIQIIRDVCDLANNVVIADALRSMNSKSCLDVMVELQKYINDWDTSSLPYDNQINLPWQQVNKLSEILLTMVQGDPTLSYFVSNVEGIKERIHFQTNKHNLAQQQQDSGHFVWRDGILVEALLKGHWLLLENANLCPASVLDRLNSVTERDGFFLLSESGTQETEDNSNSHRVIKPHKNFRIFFTMNAASGEISRAMRNRCVEISLLDSAVQYPLQSENVTSPSFSKLQIVDFLSTLRCARIRSMEVASAIINANVSEIIHSSSFEESPNLRSVLESVRLLPSLLCRGLDPGGSGRNFMQLSFEVEESAIAIDFASDILDAFAISDGTPLPGTLLLKSAGNEAPVINTVWRARLLRLFTKRGSSVEDAISPLGLLRTSETDGIDRSALVFPSFHELQCILSQLFLKSTSLDQLKLQASAINGFRSPLSYTVQWMASVLGETMSQTEDAEESTHRDECTNLTWRRLKQRFVENLWEKNLARKDAVLDSTDDLMVLEASYYMHENLLDQAAVPCSVTGLLYRFFLAIDNWAENIVYAKKGSVLMKLLPLLSVVLDERDKLWTLLKDLPLDSTIMNGFSAFNESEFIVQWQWLQKRTPKAEFRDSFVEGWDRVEMVMDTIDGAIFGGPRPTWSNHGVRKKMLSPLVPRQSKHWDALFSLEGLSDGCSLVVDYRFDPFQKQGVPIDLHHLMELCHASLYVTTEEKNQLLAAICTSQLSWTNLDSGQSSWIEEIDFPSKMKQVFGKLKASFDIEIASAKVDLDIQTVDNQIEPKFLDELRDLSKTTMSKIDGYSNLKTRLLNSFAKIQISALAEFWCVHQEVNLCGQLSKLLLMSKDEKDLKAGLLRLKDDIQRLVEIAISKTIWRVSDMRTFQLLVWALDGNSSKNQSLRILLRSLLPTMLSNLSRHSFTGSFVCQNSISSSLEMPDMWSSDDAHNDSLFGNLDLADREFAIGNARLQQPVRTEFLFNTIGIQLSFSKKPARTKFFTIENAVQREDQSKEMLNVLSTLCISPSNSRLFVQHCILFDILTAVRVLFQDNSMDEVLSLVKNNKKFAASSIEQIKSAGDAIGNNFFGLFWDDLLFPLLKSLHRAWQEDTVTTEYDRQCSLASIYLGLLRLNLLTPCSPLDPGRAPLAKVSLITKQLLDIQSRLVATRLHSGFVDGNFSPETSETRSLIERTENLSKKRTSQQKKVVERTESAPPFSELFRETREFLTTASGNDTVLEMIENLSTRTVDKVKGSIERRAENWQRTAAAFCRRLSNDFSAYEDVTTSIIDSVRMIQDGLFDLNHQRMGIDEKQEQLKGIFFDELHKYPIPQGTYSIKVLQGATCIRNFESKPECVKTLSIAMLARLLLKKQVVGLNEEEMALSSRLFTGLTNSFDGFVGAEEDAGSLEEIKEKAFREQFPDHRKAFNDLFKDASVELDENTTEDAREDDPEINENDKSLTESQTELLYELYNGIFSGKKTFHIDSIRKIAFHSSYAAAYEFQKAFGHTGNSRLRSELMGGHAFAICLSSIPREKMTRPYSYFRESSTVVDFHNEACPSMALSASGPLENLMARTTQLLTAFPGHAILIGLGKVCEKVHKLNIITTPIGKVMTGLEVILKQAQDWEQHASEKVKIGSPLAAIGRLISEWRKFELESWGELIQGRHQRHIKKTRQHWLRLRGVLDIVSIKDNGESTHRSTSMTTKMICTVPQWVWKGSSDVGSKLFHVLDDEHRQNLKDLVKALDTFMLTSPLGEFEERLKIVKTCAEESTASLNALDKESSWKLQQSRILYSIWMYYSQYLSILTRKLTDLRAPVEEKLKNETKLAKWDNQSYYALAESTERNQRKLMKILSEFDESLFLNVGIIIQEEGCSGLRSNVEAHDEFCATFPSFTSMFPMRGVIKENVSNKSSRPPHTFDFIDIVTIDEKLINLTKDGHLWKISKYAQKMKSLYMKNSKNPAESTIRVGGDTASAFCQAIFDRVESLRENSTRPMKERALVDLFRELKENGYTTTKWSTPSQLKDIEQMFLLPTPKLGADEKSATNDTALSKAEQYYVKCISEAHALKSETMMLGSKHMSKREMDSMVNLCYSGMHLLTQQRCLLSTLLHENHKLKEWIASVKDCKLNLPPCQSYLREAFKSFRRKQAFAFESIRQLSLLLQSSKTLITGDDHINWIRDTISKVESLFSESYYSVKEHSHFVTWEMLEGIGKDQKILFGAKELVQESRRRCRDLSCLPLDPFDACLANIEDARASARKCSEHLNESSKKGLILKSKEFSEKVSSLIERVLVTYQNLNKEFSNRDQSQDPLDDNGDELLPDVSIWKCHLGFLKACAKINMQELNENLSVLIGDLRDLHNGQSISSEERECFVRLVSNTSVLVAYLHQLSESLLQDYLHFYSSTAKLNYVILRLFRSLVAKGYCSDKTAEEDGEGEGDIKGMTFDDDNDGTGMGEGEGKKDVTDQIENEDQLAGLKSDKDDEDDQKNQDESKQLNEDEADQGMEMEGDFDGEMFDLPEKPQDDNEMEEDEGEELDTEMGDEANRDDQVVDEKMWNDSDDEDDINKDEEKFEEDSGVKGEAIEDAMRTKEDDEEGGKADDDDESPSNQDQQDKNREGSPDEGEDEQDDQEINEDAEDGYEDNHDVDVRGEENEETQEDTGDPMQLEDNLELDENDQGDDADDAEAEETGEHEETASLSAGSEGDDDNLGEDNVDDEGEDEEAENEKKANQAEGPMDLEKEGGDEPEKEEQDNAEEPPIDKSGDDPVPEEAHGIRSKDGTDAIVDDGEEEGQEEDSNDENEVVGNPSGGKSDGNQAEMDGNDGGGYSEDQVNEADNEKSNDSSRDIPNPFKDPGDASKFWHRKLNVIDSNDSPDESNKADNKDEDKDVSQNEKDGDFEYSADQNNSTQVLGEVAEEEAVEMDLEDNQDEKEVDEDENEHQKESLENETETAEQKKMDKSQTRQKDPKSSMDQKDQITHDEDLDEEGSIMDDIVKDESENGDEDEDMEAEEDDADTGLRVMSDLSKLRVDGDTSQVEASTQLVQDEYISSATAVEVEEARSQWLSIQGETQSLSRRLCEKLRLVMEPLVASKLRGDYRTGKRINMKRVIGYIASGYRKDKIWLRRTKPAKRNYRVLLAVDDSESMKKSGAGEMALRAMATVAVGMNQLEIGELGVASFGDDMKVVHPFHMPFTAESGVSVVRNFKFEQQRTHIAMCVESAMTALEDSGDQSSMQLVFLISDGRIERDSRSALKRLIREMVERNILLAMIIVEGNGKKKDSILNMKEVSFEKGKPVVKRFIDDYPFPYYIVLDEVASLPEVLGDALKQWFEMLTQLQTS